MQYKDRTRQKQWVRKQQLRAAAAAEQAGSPEAGRQAKPRQEPVRERKLPSAKRRQLDAQQDVADFAAEYRMLKKLKKGKVSEVRHETEIWLAGSECAACYCQHVAHTLVRPFLTPVTGITSAWSCVHAACTAAP